MAIGLEEDELGMALGKLEEPAKAADDSGSGVEEEKEEPQPTDEAKLGGALLGAEPDDDLDDWIAETEDVAVAAGDPAPAAPAPAPAAAAAAVRAAASSKRPEPEKQEAAVASETVGDVADSEADDTAALLLAMAPRESEAERLVARSFLLRSRGVGQAPAPAVEAAVAAEDDGEVEEAPGGGDGESAEAAVLIDEADEPRAGGVAETPDEVKAALEEELRLLEQEISGDEPELVGAAAPEVVLDAESGPEPEEAVPLPSTPEDAGQGPAEEAAPLPATPEDAGQGPAEEAAAWEAEEEAGEYDPDALLAEANAEIWDVDELEAQAEAFGAIEATREKAKDGTAKLDAAKEPKSPAAAQLSPMKAEEEAAPEEAPTTVVKLQPKAKCQLKRSAPSAGSAAPKAKAARQQGPTGGRPFDLKHVVVNFVEVGRAYARSQPKGQPDEEDGFDWEGVRSCVQCLESEHNLQVLGVLPAGFEGEDSWSDGTCGLPEDVRAFCKSVEEIPSSSSSSCSVQTVVRAHRQNCRFVDGEDGSSDLGDAGPSDPECRAWLERRQDVLQIPYAYDPSAGTFKAAEGSLSRACAGAGEAPAVAGS